MFAQANSEHCRHKIFRADWWIDDEPQSHSLFDMIRNTHAATQGQGVLSAYHDNAAVIELSGDFLAPAGLAVAMSLFRQARYLDEGRDTQPSYHRAGRCYRRRR